MTTQTRFEFAFQAGDFDAIRAMLGEDVKLDLVNRPRLDGKDGIAPYFARYAEAEQWRYALGAVEGRPEMLVFDESDLSRPAHFVLVACMDKNIEMIRDFLFAAYVLEAIDGSRIGA